MACHIFFYTTQHQHVTAPRAAVPCATLSVFNTTPTRCTKPTQTSANQPFAERFYNKLKAAQTSANQPFAELFCNKLVAK